MPEREPAKEYKEYIERGALVYLWHPGTEEVFSGYGLTLADGRPDRLVGLLMVDRPEPVSVAWLEQVGNTFGGYQLLAMTASGEQGIACQMQIEPDSLPYLRRFPSEKSEAIQSALRPLLDYLPQPVFAVQWDDTTRTWRSEFIVSPELPPELKEVFARTGYGCASVETDRGIIHACHAADADIAGFAGKPVWFQWQMIQMPTAPLIRLEMVIVDNPVNPFCFESFLNVGEPDQLRILARLASQGHLHMAFYGGDLTYQYTKSIHHDEQQWQQLDEITELALVYWQALPPDQRDFDQAKAAYIRQFA
ncbi:MAG: hypothetical protein KJ069_26080 [Anaerolineae bacterium]|nr:hypothetical protein [Anaerolineae bacterium]